jgi:hypothetical protein
VRRRLPNLLTAVSLLLCVAVCVLWVRSYWRPAEWIVARRPTHNIRLCRTTARSPCNQLSHSQRALVLLIRPF